MRLFKLSSLPKFSLAILLFVASLFSQDTKCELAKSRLSELRAQLQDKFKNRKYDRAYEIAIEMVDVGKSNCDANDDILLTLYMNVAQVQINRKQFDDAQKIYDQNLELAERVYGANSSDFQRYSEDLLKLSVRTVGTEKFETYALKLLDAKNKRFGGESVEFMNELTRMARFYMAWKRFDIAEKYFSQAMDVADKLPPEKVALKEKVVNRYRVFLITRYGENEGLLRGEALMKQRFPDFPINERVLNGLAYSLPKPIYPAQARNMRAQGSISVKIKIDKKGRVISAQGSGGHPLLLEAAERAARAAKFLPTFFKGQPVEVEGIVTYHFIDRSNL